MQSRIIIFTGKGGVGKTTIAAAHALKAAQQGKKTLLISTDQAHNLSDLFQIELGKEEVTVREQLDVIELDSNYEMMNHYSAIMQAIQKMFPSIDGTIAELEDIMIFPGVDELFSLLKIQEYVEKKQYEVIIVDCAPTGETLSLLKLPELLAWYMERVFPLERIALKVLRPISKSVFQLELPNEQAMNEVEQLYLKVRQLQELLKNREITSIRLVTLPEKMVVEESKRNYMYMNLYNFNVDQVFINRVLPEEVTHSFFKDWIAIQKKYIEELEQVFGEIPIQRVKWYELDRNGIEGVEQIVEDSLQEDCCLEVRHVQQNERYEKLEKGYLLKLNLPFIEKEQLELHQCGNELSIRIANYKRNIPLPDVLRGMEVTKAKFNNQELQIEFE